MVKVLTTAIIALCSVSTFSELININFDTNPDGSQLNANSVLTEQYADWGVHFSALDDGVIVNSAVESTIMPLSGNYWTNVGNQRYYPRFDRLSVYFDHAVSNVSMSVNPFGYLQNVSFTAFNAQHVNIQTLTAGIFDGYSPLSWSRISFSASNIWSIEITPPNSSWCFGVDNLSFETTSQSVPEPESMALFLAGFGVMIVTGSIRFKKLPKKKVPVRFKN